MDAKLIDAQDDVPASGNNRYIFLYQEYLTH